MHDNKHQEGENVDGVEDDLNLEAKNRRAALRKLGKYAAAAPVVTTLLVSKSAHPASFACSSGVVVSNPLFCPPDAPGS